LKERTTRAWTKREEEQWEVTARVNAKKRTIR
jgi:hypothetical protein